MLLSTLGAILLRNLWRGKGAIATGQWRVRPETLATRANMPWRSKNRAGKGTIRTGHDLILPHSWTNLEIQKYY